MNLTMHELQISPVAVTRTIPNAELHLLPKNLQIQVVNNEVREAVCCMVSYSLGIQSTTVPSTSTARSTLTSAHTCRSIGRADT